MAARTTTTLATAGLWLLLAGCAQSTMTLTLPRLPAAGEAVRLHFLAGVLPPGGRIVVRLADGEIVGSAAPYGMLGGVPGGESGGEYILPLSPGAIRDGKVTLRFEVEAEGKVRAPRRGEVGKVELVYAPVTD